MSFKDDIYQLSAAPLQLSISKISSIRGNETMLTAENHSIFKNDDENLHIDISDDLIPLDVESEDLARLNDTIEGHQATKPAPKPRTCHQKYESSSKPTLKQQNRKVDHHPQNCLLFQKILKKIAQK